MQECDYEKIKTIKLKIAEMLRERHQLQNNDMAILSPSDYWADFCSYFDYMLDLPEEYFAKLRLHTYHLTGDNYQTYILQDPQNYKDVADSLGQDIPSNLILNEPETGIGFQYKDGRFISRDIIRFQRVINTLYRHNILSQLSNAVNQQRNYLLEIGAGYGGLAHHLSNVLENTTYIIVDLPETLLFSAAYLSLLNPEKNIYLYDSDGFSGILSSNALESYDFVLIPNYHLQALRHLQFELVINIASFQEMRVEQVDLYLEFISQTCTGILYSLNQDRQPRNRELSNLSEMLGAKFELLELSSPLVVNQQQKKIVPVKRELKKALKSAAALVGLLDRSDQSASSLLKSEYREFICKPLIEMSLKDASRIS